MKQKITLLLGAAVSVGCLYWVFKDVDFKQFAQALKSINPLWLCASLALFYWSMYLRAVRWGLLFKPALDLNGRRLFRPIMICFAFNSIMPGRVGELVRALFVSKRENTGLPMAFATVVSE
ncbi:flippase-like domain-containing protein, partial [Candidatus Sumerlaeota bacterium]|nr:flippase-like domain-containing protein [Candidatus Sumerlaeota bacterium]